MTLADFWGIEANVPELDDNKGTSLIFVNSDKGRECFEKIKENIIFKVVDIDRTVICNPSAIRASIYTKKKLTFYKIYKKENFDLLINKLMKESITKKNIIL